MKKITKWLFITACCLIPTIFAVFSYWGSRETPLELSSVSSMILEGPSGSRYELNGIKKQGNSANISRFQ